MKKLIAILIGVLTTINIWGAKAFSEPLTITQKDGKQLTFQLHGDEHFNYIATTDGVLLCRVGKDYYIAAIDENGKMSSSGVLAHNAGQRTEEEIVLIGKQDKNKFFACQEVIETKEAKRVMKRINMPNGSSTLFPHTGSPKALVILADFKDVPFKHDDNTTMEIFDQYLNAVDARPTHASDATLSKNIGSVAKYFYDMSYGSFTPQFEVAAVVHLSENMSVYGEDWEDTNGRSHSSRMDLFIPEVCELAHDAGVDFSRYDENDDGYVDLVYVIFAGYGQSFNGVPAETIWPQSGTPKKYPSGSDMTSFCELNGKKVYRYGVHSELNFSPTFTTEYFNDNPQINGIGLFCHEFSHCMGLPDFYPTTKTAQDVGNPAMEFWDLMDGGEYSGFITVTINGTQKMKPGSGYNPTAYTAWEREYMGWKEMEVLKDEDSGQQIELVSIDKSDDGTAYKIYPNDDESGNEYVFIQNIQPYGWNSWLANNMGNGMLVTYVNYDATAFSLSYNRVNNTVGKSRMTIVPADGQLISSYLQGSNKPYTQNEYYTSFRGDPFPGSQNVNELLSIPMIWSGTNMEKPLLKIKEENNIITFYYQTLPQITTGISETDKTDDSGTPRIYTIDGRNVGNSTKVLPKGIYIINGKKAVIR